ncbi:MAG: hypothetical protein ACJAQT_001608 [Akkermansiaceae bacterium]
MSEETVKRDPWWKRWFINPVLKQLTQGISADKLAWTIAVGCALGIFPIMGMTSVVCFLAATYWRLNHPVIQVVCHTLWAAHFALILPFIKLGQWIHGDEPITQSIATLLKEFFSSPWQFTQDYWLAAWQGIVAWFIVAIPLIFLVRVITFPLLKVAAGRIEKRKEATA